jgi:hypothetical protein
MRRFLRKRASDDREPAIRLRSSLRLDLLVLAATQIQRLHPLPTLESLQKDLSAVRKAHRITMPKSCDAPLHKGHLLDLADSQIFWDIAQPLDACRAGHKPRADTF